jgi:hypothetical protein
VSAALLPGRGTHILHDDHLMLTGDRTITLFEGREMEVPAQVDLTTGRDASFWRTELYPTECDGSAILEAEYAVYRIRLRAAFSATRGK